jgi:retinol-binding protein 3
MEKTPKQERPEMKSTAAEELAYDLQQLKRATIVGEKTGGGAHTTKPHRLHDHFGMQLPAGRAINPISKTNWAGSGVLPDVSVPAAEALQVAQAAAQRTSTEPPASNRK